jgi:serpin B
VAIQPEFARELSGWPTAAVREAPFQTDPDGARRQINADVSHTTHRLIPELLRPGVIKRDTGATLVNALYLKVAWANRFPARGTTPEKFHSPSGTADVPTMRLNKRLNYAAADGWQVVVLPAAGDVQGIVLLPDGDLATVEADLSADTLAGLLAAPTAAALDLHLPKFRVRADASLDDALTGLGVRTMFSDSADFAGISDTQLAIDTVVHEAVLTIDELGLEGAAATAAVARMLSMQAMPSRPVVVRVDRPFLFLVRHRPSGAVYFLSRVVRP